MTQPPKTCPQCGQPAVLEMAQCRRCGFVYPPSAPAAPPLTPQSHPLTPGYPSPAPAPRILERPAQQRQASQRALLLALALLGCLALAVVVVGLRRLNS